MQNAVYHAESASTLSSANISHAWLCITESSLLTTQHYKFPDPDIFAFDNEDSAEKCGVKRNEIVTAMFDKSEKWLCVDSGYWLPKFVNGVKVLEKLEDEADFAFGHYRAEDVLHRHYMHTNNQGHKNVPLDTSCASWHSTNAVVGAPGPGDPAQHRKKQDHLVVPHHTDQHHLHPHHHRPVNAIGAGRHKRPVRVTKTLPSPRTNFESGLLDNTFMSDRKKLSPAMSSASTFDL